MAQKYNVFAVVQGGRLQYEAIIFVATFFQKNPNFKGRLILGEPENSDRWDSDPRINNENVRRLLTDLGAEIRPFQNGVFGSRYPNGNKIMGLTCLPDKEPFVFFDTDTMFSGRLSTVSIGCEVPVPLTTLQRRRRSATNAPRPSRTTDPGSGMVLVVKRLLTVGLSIASSKT